MARVLCEDDALGAASHLHDIVLSDQVLDYIGAYNAVHPFLDQPNRHHERYHPVSFELVFVLVLVANLPQDGHCRCVDLSCELGSEVSLPEHVLPPSTRAATEGAGY